MKRFITSVLTLSIVSLSLAGCAEKSTSKTETQVSTPGGKTTVTTEKEIKQEGENPPPVRK
jgi:predicted small lipoprotein YifL